jgi:hypothetical protein
VLGGNGLGNYGNGGTYGAAFNGLDDYKKAFKVLTPTSNSGPVVFSPSSSSSSGKDYADRYPTYKPNGKQFGAAGQFISNNQFSGNGDYQFNNGADSSFGSTSYEECVCVPYDQCSAINHVGRKDDLYLAIDPRNLNYKEDIEADTVEAVVTDGNGTMTIVQVPKGMNATEQIEQAKNEQRKEAAGEVTKRNRRDVKHVSEKNDKQEIQEVSRFELSLSLFLRAPSERCGDRCLTLGDMKDSSKFLQYLFPHNIFRTFIQF